MSGQLIKIPRGFFDDHADRELPTPYVVRATGQHYFISRDDPDLSELISDACYYADNGCDCGPTLVRMARSLLRALGR